MKYRTSIFLVVALLITGLAAAQGDWATHTRAGEWAFAQGDYERAEAEFQAALNIAQGLPQGNPKLETSLENLARFYEHQSDFEKAQPLYQLQMAVQEVRLGENDPGLLDALVAVARTSQPIGDLPTTQASLLRYVGIAEATGQADPGQWWRMLAMLARTSVLQDRQEQALRWQQKAVEVLADDRRATETERADVLESLARMELLAGEGRRAEILFVQVAQLRVSEDEADAVPTTMADGSAAAFSAGEMETAERLALRALNATPNADAELTARTTLAMVSWMRVRRGTNDLASLLAASHDDEELTRARDRLRALEVFEEGKDDETLRRLVQVEALRGQPAGAAKWQRSLLEYTAATAGPSSPATVSARRDLVTLLAAAGHNEEALAENALVISAMGEAFGDRDPRLVPQLERRLELLTDLGRKKEAKAVRKRIKKQSRK